jgi:hypothetical protein
VPTAFKFTTAPTAVGDDESAALWKIPKPAAIRAWSGQCPDPHGKLERYTLALNERCKGPDSSPVWARPKGFFTWIFLWVKKWSALGMYTRFGGGTAMRKASDRRKATSARQSSGGGVPPGENVSIAQVSGTFERERERETVERESE